MKKTFAFAASTLLMASSAFANGYSVPQTSLVPAPTTASCFNGSELQFDGFAVANFQDENTEWGGGVGLNYFFNPYFGLGTDLYWAEIDGSSGTNLSGSAILRLPIEPWCSALYAFGGGGGAFYKDEDSVGTAHLGFGLEWRPVGADGIAIFSDLRYTWADEEAGVESAPQLRIGLRAIF